MRTLQIRAVCDTCETAEFYDTPIKMVGPNVTILKLLEGPPGWIMTEEKVYCSKDCKKNKKQPVDKTSLRIEAETEWKEWQEYCKVKDAPFPFAPEPVSANHDHYYSDNY